jgi:PAS domain S-box-containing protein
MEKKKPAETTPSSSGKVPVHSSQVSQVDESSLHDEISRLRHEIITLRESEDKYKFIFEHSAVGKSITMPSGEINVNEAFCRMLGYTLDEFKKQRWQDITHPDDIEMTRAQIDRLLAGEGESARFTKRFIHRDGSTVWVDLNTTLRRDANGAPLYFMSTLSDITDRIHSEVTLKELTAELQLIFKNMINAFIVWESTFDNDGNYVSFRFGQFNDSYARMSNLKLEDVLGKDVFEVWPATEQSWVEVYGNVAVTGNPNTFDMYHEPTRGWYHCNAYRPTDSPDRICVIFEDITGQKKAQDLINSQMDELRRWHAVLMGREDRILALKSEINHLLVEAGKPIRYTSSQVAAEENKHE